jgi:hypothetical protein
MLPAFRCKQVIRYLLIYLFMVYLKMLSVAQSISVFHKLFSIVAHPNLSKTHHCTPQNSSSCKGGTKLYMATNMYLHINKSLPYKNAGI